MSERTYKVTYKWHWNDTNPTVKIFNDFDEMQDWIANEKFQRGSLTEGYDHESAEEIESSLIHIEEL